MSTMWHKSLEPGDLVIARNYASKRRHILELLRCGATYDRRQGTLDGTGQILDYSTSWNGRSLCTVLKHAAYYWTPIPAPITTYTAEDDLLCERCRRVWQAAGSLPIRSDAETVTNADYPPPFGWRAVPAVGHPWDVPPEADPEKVKDATGKVRGERRTELRRWQRGPRVVRLVHYYTEGYDAAHYHDVRRPLEDAWHQKSNPDEARRKAQEFMARGGD